MHTAIFIYSYFTIHQSQITLPSGSSKIKNKKTYVMYAERNIMASSLNHFPLEIKQCFLCVSLSYVPLSGMWKVRSVTCEFCMKN
jgi:hypothetical protein